MYTHNIFIYVSMFFRTAKKVKTARNATASKWLHHTLRGFLIPIQLHVPLVPVPPARESYTLIVHKPAMRISTWVQKIRYVANIQQHLYVCTYVIRMCIYIHMKNICMYL